MKLLLDTHTLIWASDGRLSGDARDAIEERADAVFVSSATIWEIEIKRTLGRLQAPQDVAELVDDRMLVAQARLEGMTLATADARIRRYDVAVLDVPRG